MEKEKIYVINEPKAIELMECDDIDGFRQYLKTSKSLNYTLYEFDSLAESNAFMKGFLAANGLQGRYILWSAFDDHMPFIEAIENPTMEKVTVYLIYDAYAAQCVDYNDIDAFREYFAEENYITVKKKTFESSMEVDLFADGLFCDIDERAPLDWCMLQDDRECDLPFIEVLKNY